MSYNKEMFDKFCDKGKNNLLSNSVVHLIDIECLLFGMLLFLVSSCIDKAEDLGANKLLDDINNTIQIKSHDLQSFGTVTVKFDIDYDIESNQGINGIAVFSNGGLDFVLPIDRREFTEIGLAGGSTVCYELAFSSNGNDFSDKTIPYCVEIF